MTTAPTAAAADAAPDPQQHRHLGLALAVICVAQLMVVLDATVMNVALPSIQKDLGFTNTGLTWVITAYSITFGGLLLFGGRTGDLYGRRRMFMLGVGLFAFASLLGGLATSEWMLVVARGLQGIGGAIAAPTALALLATTFTEPDERARAFGVFAAMAASGGALGLLLGGILTDYLDWRWVFFVNIPIGLLVLAGSLVLNEGQRNPGRLDLPGALTATTGLLALVYAITRGGTHGWTDTLTLSCLAAAALLLVAFVLWQTRTNHPMLPLRLFASRSRSGSYATMLFIGAGMFATFYFLTLYMQQVLGYSAVKTGLAYLPFSIGMGIAAATSSKLVERVEPRNIAGPGLLLAATGMGWLGGLQPDSSYTTHIAPAMFIVAVGLGLSFVPMTLGAVSHVRDQDTGIASALLNTAQQIGGALGLAVLATIATTASNHKLPDAAATFFRGLAMHNTELIQTGANALTHGYTTAFLIADVFFITGAIIALTTIRARPATADNKAHNHIGL